VARFVDPLVEEATRLGLTASDAVTAVRTRFEEAR
jgi:hypothetical protein